MKILRVSLTNVNSLAGTWTIDFDSPEFRSEAFVVSGPTGSGKTSILDAIALALYGMTARQGNGFSKTENAVMTEGTGECIAEADFIGVDGLRYRARWEQHRARNAADGALQKITRKLFRIDANGGSTEVKAKDATEAARMTVDAAGLTFEQFVRSVVLQQGDFASFLTAEKGERADLLEKAVRDTRFSEAGRRVFAACQKAKDARSDAETVLLERIGLAVPADGRKKKPSDEEIDRSIQAANEKLDAEKKGAEEKRKDAEDRSDRLAKEIAALDAEKNWVDAEAGFKTEAEDLKTKRDDATGLEKAFAADRPAYEQAVLARSFDAKHAPLAKHRADKAAAESRRDGHAGDKKTADGEVQKCNDKLGEANRDQAKVASECTEKRKTIDKADDIEKKLNAEIALLSSATKTATVADGKATAAENDAKNAESAAARAEALAAAATAWTPGSAVPANFSTEAVFETLAAAAAADASVAKAEKQVEAAHEQYDAAKKKADALRADEAKGTDSELERLKETEAEAKRVFDGLKWALEQRILLADGDACPLCGSVYRTASANVPPDLETTVAKAERTWKNAESAREAKERDQKTIRDAETAKAGILAKAQGKLQQVQQTTANDKQNGLLALQGVRDAATHARKEATRKRADAKRLREEADAEAKKRTEHDNACKGFRAQLAELLVGKTVAQARKDVDDAEKAADGGVAAAQANLAAAKAKVDAAKRAIETVDREIAGLSKTIGEEETAFHAALAGSFPDEDAWSAARLDDATFGAHKAKADGIAAKNTEIETLEKSLSDRKARHDSNRPDNPRSSAELERLLGERKEEKGKADSAKGSAETELAGLVQKENDRAEAKTNWEKARALHEKWKKLNDWFGGQDGNAFRVYAQGITLGKLLVEANGPLLAMTSGRYELDWDPADNELVPVAVDHWQADDHRPISNLSGGETFLVSLALALGLGRLAGKDLPIETLFLDEGFGTLDAEKLQLALKTLSDLHGAGCNVGVVSHVDAVKTHGFDIVEVRPRGDGTSTLAGPGVSGSAPTGAAPARRRARKPKDPAADAATG